jgi:RNA polymerase sigma-70 factor (ECF subfamily)
VATVHEAQDLTQEFFARLLEKNALAAASPERGRFRSYLLTSLKNFLSNEWDRANAQKRGGGRERLSLDWESGESRLSLEPIHADTPEREFERQWALTLLDNVVRRLQEEFASAGKSRQFELLKETLTGGRAAVDYSSVAAELTLTEEAARQAAHRLRKRYRELLRDEVAATVEHDGEVEDEIGRLFDALGA